MANEYSKELLTSGLKKLHTRFTIDGDEITIKFGMGKYVIVNMNTWTIVEWCDAQDWAKTVRGIFKQMHKKLSEAK